MTSHLPEIMVTGIGAVTPLGSNAEETWRNLCNGCDGITDIDLFDMEGFRFNRGGQIRDDALAANFPDLDPQLDRLQIFALTAAAEALANCANRNNTGLIMATNFGETARTEAMIAETLGFEPFTGSSASPGYIHNTTEQIAERLKLNGPSTTLSLSCSSGTAAIALAAGWINSRRTENVLVIGADIISRLAWSGLSALRTMTKGKLSPFDIERSGTLFSEGAGALLISSSNENALARLRGWATNNNAFHLTAPSPEGDGSARVMQQALDCAGMEADEVDHINAHGTSTKHNDVTESQAIRKVFGAATDKILVTSNKSMLGHLMGAAGTVEAIASILTLRDQIIPPTINVTQQDPECCVNIVANTAIETEVANVLSNSAGIGGCNAAAIFGSVQ